MGGRPVEIWVCANCRSVNKARAKQCYNCRTPRDLAAVDPNQMEVTGHGKVREVALPPFRSSRGRAVLASIGILVVAGLQIVSVLVATALLGQLIGGAPLTAGQARLATNLSIAGPVVALLVLVVWAAWLSRVVTEMPALGLGYPPTSGLMAFVENFVPLLNLLRVPAIVRDVVRRLDPASRRGNALISAAWLGIFGGFLLPRVGGFLNVFGAGSLERRLRNQLLLEGVSTGLVVVGALFLVVLIWWIETRIARHRTAQVAVASAATTAPARTTAPVTTPPAPVTAPPAPAAAPPSELRLVVRADADGRITAELGGEIETLTADELRATAEALGAPAVRPGSGPGIGCVDRCRQARLRHPRGGRGAHDDLGVATRAIGPRRRPGVGLRSPH